MIQFLESVVKMPLMDLPVRSVCITLPNAKVLLSPGSKLTKEQLVAFGGVTDVVATNAWHAAGVPLAKEVFPNAKVWGVPGVEEKYPALQWNLLKSEAWPYSSDLEMFPLEGMPKVNEVVFLYKAKKTLIVSDLAFNLQNVKGLGARIILGLFGTYKIFGVSKFFKKYITDVSAFRASIEKVMNADFDAVVVGHGDNVEVGGKILLRQALAKRGY